MLDTDALPLSPLLRVTNPSPNFSPLTRTAHRDLTASHTPFGLQGSSSYRRSIVARLADHIGSTHPDGIVRVAIDGRPAAGKATLANELCAELSKRARPVVTLSMDGFHQPPAKRYAKGSFSAEGYYRDAFDLHAVANLLLKPLAPHGNRRYCSASYNHESNTPLALTFDYAQPGTVVLVAGHFLQREALRAHWDVTVFVDVDAPVACERGVARDAIALGGEAHARRLYAERYLPAFMLYEAECDPVRHADIVLENNDPAFPVWRAR